MSTHTGSYSPGLLHSTVPLSLAPDCYCPRQRTVFSLLGKHSSPLIQSKHFLKLVREIKRDKIGASHNEFVQESLDVQTSGVFLLGKDCLPEPAERYLSCSQPELSMVWENRLKTTNRLCTTKSASPTTKLSQWEGTAVLSSLGLLQRMENFLFLQFLPWPVISWHCSNMAQSVSKIF